jgi:hypothetical protein
MCKVEIGVVHIPGVTDGFRLSTSQKNSSFNIYSYCKSALFSMVFSDGKPRAPLGMYSLATRVSWACIACTMY